MGTVRIGNAAGFWGDNLDAPRLLCESAELEYLTLEYLAELTMSILAHQKSRNPNAGFVTDLPTVIESLAPVIKAQPNLKIVTNGGGMNPTTCALAVSKILSANDLDHVRIATVEGDDLMGDFDRHCEDGEAFQNLETAEPDDAIRDRVQCANAYLGARGIVEALKDQARIVITGRVADASLTVGPAVFEFNWQWDDWDRLAAATVAGHLIECGAQVTGGMYSDWSEQIRLSDVGYPIAEINDDGKFVITKPPNSEGTVTIGTVSEQLVYEIGDPAHYLTPDVDADFTNVRLQWEQKNRVEVSGARGNPHPKEYKVSLAYEDGYMISAMLVVCGENAKQKAELCAEMIFDRVRRAGVSLAYTNVELLGTGDSLPGIWPATTDSKEVVLRISARDPNRIAIERLSRELTPLVTSGPPGVTGYTGGRSRPRRVLAYWPTTISRSRITASVITHTAKDWLA